MGFIHDTDSDEFRGITLESRRESIVIGFDDPAAPDDISRRVFAEIAYDDIPALRLILDLAQLPGLPSGWAWERDGGFWQASNVAGTIVGCDGEELGAYTAECEYVWNEEIAAIAGLVLEANGSDGPT